MLSSTASKKEPWYRRLYIQVLIGIGLGVALGHFYPTVGADMKPLGDGFIKLIKMLLAPIIFATIVVGIARQGGRQGIALLRGALDHHPCRGPAGRQHPEAWRRNESGSGDAGRQVDLGLHEHRGDPARRCGRLHHERRSADDRRLLRRWQRAPNPLLRRPVWMRPVEDERHGWAPCCH